MLLACGRVDDGTAGGAEEDGTGGLDSAGGTGGVESVGGTGSGSGSVQNATGGEQATGGDRATGGSTGGQATDLPEPWGPCSSEHPGLEPPCNDSDVNGVVSGCGLWFDVPLAQVVPPALGLNVVLLPLEPGDGVSGVGGTAGVPTVPLPLEVFLILPEIIPWAPGETFDLLDPAGFVRAGNAHEDEVRRYVAEVEGYGVARVALRQGTEILSVYRGLYLGEVASITTSDLCIK